MLRVLKTQFFLTYAVMGSIVPLLSALLKEDKQFSESQIGILFSLLSLSIVLSPGLATLLADTSADSRRLLTAALLISAAMLASIGFVTPIVLVMALFFVHALVYSPMMALHDGFYFSATGEKGGGDAGDSDEASSYNRVRIWGSIGFICPAIPLYFLIEATGSSLWGLYVGAAFGVLGALHAFRLPRVEMGHQRKEGSIPTAEAFRVLKSPEVRWFCIAMGMVYLAGNAYYAFFPIYLREHAGVDASLLPVIANIGVVLELFFIAGLEWLRRTFGLRRLILFGVGSMVVRLSVLALFPSTLTAYLVQLLHGPEIIALFILPVMFLNRLAGDSFRNSIQGLYVMLVVGLPRIVGSTGSGMIAEYNLLLLYGISAALAALAFVILFLGFKPKRRRDVASPGGTIPEGQS